MEEVEPVSFSIEDEVQAKVDALLQELAQIKGKLADLQAQYDAAIAKKGALAYKAQQTTIRLHQRRGRVRRYAGSGGSSAPDPASALSPSIDSMWRQLLV